MITIDELKAKLGYKKTTRTQNQTAFMGKLQSFGLNPEMLTGSNVCVDCIMPERSAIGRLNSAGEIRMPI